MTDGIGRLSGYGNYGVGGYVPQRKNNEVNQEAQEKAQAQTQNREETQVDPSKVMEFLANNNYFVNVTNTPAVEGVETDPAIADRVTGYMENYELFMSIIEEEFGEELAPMVMDFVMDNLMGMAA